MICSVTWASGFAVVDAQRRTLVEAGKRKNQSAWGDVFQGNLSLPNTRLSPTYNSLGKQSKTGLSPIFDSLGKPPGQAVFNFNCNSTSTIYQTWATDWTFFDIFTDSYLGLTKQETPRIQLYEFENMLEDWVAMNLYIYNKANVIVNLNGGSSNVSTTVPVRRQVSELQLRALPVFAGFFASFIMLLVALAIAFTTPALRSHPNEVGMLQLLWLSDVKFDLGLDIHPTEGNLRKAGLATSVSLVNGVGVLRQRRKSL
ncbi:hypothetical protein DL96DRAFT_586972 [Flagelloscypha sp. PMI_526]|nr:hypothetical protein DL96DRAFT_586972 [Flagelloscypha sp. PMI_526]